MILVTGIPRSGTSWIAEVLCYSDKVKGYYEPDNEHNNLLGYIHKQHLHRFPYLKADNSNNGLYTIFRKAISDHYIHEYSKPSLAIKKLLNINLATAEREIYQKCNPEQATANSIRIQTTSQNLRLKLATMFYTFLQLFVRFNRHKKIPLIKSVHCLLALANLRSVFNTKVLIILRHPASIISSHLRIKNPDINRNLIIQKALVDDYLQPYIDKIYALKDPLEKAGAQVAIFYYILACQIKENPDWSVVKHEDVCLHPKQKFKKLYKQLNLDWSDTIDDKIDALNKKGKGYSTKRISRQEIDKWSYELEPSQIEKIKRGYNVIPPSFYKEFIYQNVSPK